MEKHVKCPEYTGKIFIPIDIILIGIVYLMKFFWVDIHVGVMEVRGTPNEADIQSTSLDVLRKSFLS